MEAAGKALGSAVKAVADCKAAGCDKTALMIALLARDEALEAHTAAAEEYEKASAVADAAGNPDSAAGSEFMRQEDFQSVLATMNEAVDARIKSSLELADLAHGAIDRVRSCCAAV